MKDLLEILRAMASKKDEVESRRELFHEIAERVVKHACNAFGAKPDEVAILMTTSDGKHLRFVAPRKFADLGTIPITKRDSIAVNVFAKKAGEAMNNVPMVKHVAFFESLKIRDRVAPIQKMITVPIVHDGGRGALIDPIDAVGGRQYIDRVDSETHLIRLDVGSAHLVTSGKIHLPVGPIGGVAGAEFLWAVLGIKWIADIPALHRAARECVAAATGQVEVVAVRVELTRLGRRGDNKRGG